LQFAYFCQFRDSGLIGCAFTGTNRKSGSNKASSESRKPQEFPIVGIGASAGGLEAFKVLLEGLPVDTGLYVERH
jgi:chemotaxis response regulator CheB